jgi:hypothetical protein
MVDVKLRKRACSRMCLPVHILKCFKLCQLQQVQSEIMYCRSGKHCCELGVMFSEAIRRETIDSGCDSISSLLPPASLAADGQDPG